jgi:hypothetical protein
MQWNHSRGSRSHLSWFWKRWSNNGPDGRSAERAGRRRSQARGRRAQGPGPVRYDLRRPGGAVLAAASPKPPSRRSFASPLRTATSSARSAGPFPTRRSRGIDVRVRNGRPTGGCRAGGRPDRRRRARAARESLARDPAGSDRRLLTASPPVPASEGPPITHLGVSAERPVGIDSRIRACRREGRGLRKNGE